MMQAEEEGGARTHSASVASGSNVEQTVIMGQEPPASLHAGGGGTAAHAPG